MRYHSTRSLDQQLTSREAVLQGLAADGGLFVTDELPELHIDPASLTGGYAGAAAVCSVRFSQTSAPKKSPAPWRRLTEIPLPIPRSLR